MRRCPLGSATGNMPHATDQTCIFHVLYFPLDKSARGLLIIWGTDLHQNIPCLHLTTRRQGKVHWKWQLYCVLMRWEAKFKNLSNETKADLVMMDDVSTRFSRGRFKGSKLKDLHHKLLQFAPLLEISISRWPDQLNAVAKNSDWKVKFRIICYAFTIMLSMFQTFKITLLSLNHCRSF